MSLKRKFSRTEEKERTRRENDMCKQLGITKDQFQKIKLGFQAIDRNKNGYITETDLKEVVHLLGQNMSDRDITDMMRKADKNGSGNIEFEEFVEMLAPRFKEKDEVEREMKEAFQMFDTDGDGFINERELRVALTRVGEALTDAQVQDVFRDADKDGDGRISYDEFAKYICSNM
ncbi:calmodulin-2/4-like [Gigantopelta aegis]|uniref:calmodulin-2/4-like n=1 Tax=Gigantopelta aegis TaxID=1735272 RepID=UPI001B88B3EE|nr:calmodulin-2/4-like [Gigantopelta aegis]